MDGYLGKAINDLFKQIKEKPKSKEDTREEREEPNSEIILEDDDLNQYINDINRPSINNSRRSGTGRGSIGSQIHPNSGKDGTGSSIMNIAQGNVAQAVNNSKSFTTHKNLSLDSLGTSDEAANTD